MNSIYHESDTNSINATNENEKENRSGSIPEVSKRKFSKKKKADNRKETITEATTETTITVEIIKIKIKKFLGDSIV